MNHHKNRLTDRAAKVVLVVYHRVLPRLEANPLETIVSQATFIRQLDRLARRYPIAAMGDVLEQRRSGSPGAKTQVVLTFDDGYCDNYEVVLPILKAKGLPATFCVVTDYLDARAPVWDWELVTHLLAPQAPERIGVNGFAIQQQAREPRLRFALRALEALKSAPRQTISEVLAALKRHGSRRMSSTYPDVCMTWEQVSALQRSGMEIGAHSCSHRSLSRIPFTEALEEMRNSKRAIEERLGIPCRHFAFPFGSRWDYDAALLGCAGGELGFESCLLNTHGYNHVLDDAGAFRRVIMTESTPVDALLG